jgi:prevent-host-death family protein
MLIDIYKLVHYTSIMKTKRKSIGSFDAKTHLARLLDEVQSGIEFIITKRGKPVARLIRYQSNDEHIDVHDIISQFDEIRGSVKGNIDIKEYIKKGRKY